MALRSGRRRVAHAWPVARLGRGVDGRRSGAWGATSKVGANGLSGCRAAWRALRTRQVAERACPCPPADERTSGHPGVTATTDDVLQATGPGPGRAVVEHWLGGGHASDLLMGGGCLVPDAVQVGSQGGHSIGVEPVDPACGFCSGHDEAAILEDAKVLGHRRPADRQVLGQLTHRARVPGQ
jgi:hypothetical protein